MSGHQSGAINTKYSSIFYAWNIRLIQSQFPGYMPLSMSSEHFSASIFIKKNHRSSSPQLVESFARPSYLRAASSKLTLSIIALVNVAYSS